MCVNLDCLYIQIVILIDISEREKVNDILVKREIKRKLTNSKISECTSAFKYNMRRNHDEYYNVLELNV